MAARLSTDQGGLYEGSTAAIRVLRLVRVLLVLSMPHSLSVDFLRADGCCGVTGNGQDCCWLVSVSGFKCELRFRLLKSPKLRDGRSLRLGSNLAKMARSEDCALAVRFGAQVWK